MKYKAITMLNRPHPFETPGEHKKLAKKLNTAIMILGEPKLDYDFS